MKQNDTAFQVPVAKKQDNKTPPNVLTHILYSLEAKKLNTQWVRKWEKKFSASITMTLNFADIAQNF